MTVQEQQGYMTAGDVTRILRIDKSTVYRMAEDGRLPGFKVGRQWRFRVRDVESRLGIAVESLQATPIDLAGAENVARYFASLFDVMVVITDLDGRPLTDIINSSDYFELLRADPAVVDACAFEWRGYAEEYDFSPRYRESHLGFLCARAYIRDRFELVAMVIAGGIAPADWPNDETVATVAKRHGINGEALIAAAANLPTFDQAGSSEMLSGLSLLARHLSPKPRSAL